MQMCETMKKSSVEISVAGKKCAQLPLFQVHNSMLTREVIQYLCIGSRVEHWNVTCAKTCSAYNSELLESIDKYSPTLQTPNS